MKIFFYIVAVTFILSSCNNAPEKSTTSIQEENKVDSTNLQLKDLDSVDRNADEMSSMDSIINNL